MVDDFKTLKDSIFKAVFSATQTGDSSKANNSSNSLRDMVGALASLAGKGKDEIVQIISREIGLAVAGLLREPINQALRDKKMRITIEFVPDDTPQPKRKTKKTPEK